ncbi:hypothetical protein SKAU_G00216090 [Synaphobranchus kaupii]|uniref:Uncharacterized protein n=1 Tax=Synaphobranchus kaupii TaxID=118154 RepID=A0A9Q1FA25_SYNKA|nr:hypothetical protein SKAU_G00216090 [Synaphobranchus kaupii]
MRRTLSVRVSLGGAEAQPEDCMIPFPTVAASTARCQVTGYFFCKTGRGGKKAVELQPNEATACPEVTAS